MTEKKKKIILVEDDLAIVDIYTTLMKKAGFDVKVINLGQEVINMVKNIEEGSESKPDIILLDLILPDVSGIEVFKEIKKGKKTKDIKVFILTNQKEVQPQELGDAKPDRFITKADITPTQLLEVIKELWIK
ncbi:MAG: response regulator [Candidatus Staskawiczbacteria bacterium]|nr:response regulator [Candidatus Staskawiczbacteria bacterium]